MVNTLTQKSFNVSAFPLGIVALEPFGFVKDGMDCLVLSLDLTYFQNVFGFPLRLHARFCSKSRFSTLATDHVYLRSKNLNQKDRSRIYIRKNTMFFFFILKHFFLAIKQ